MNARSSRGTVIALLFAVTLRGAYGAPEAETARLKASHCCATRCNHPQAPPLADDCCQVATHATDAATVQAALHISPSLGTAWSVALPAALSVGGRQSVPAVALDPRGVGPPLFIALRTLRL